MRKKIAYKITLTEPQTEIWKNGSQKISLTEPQLLEPLNCERHAQCFEWQQSSLEDAFSASMLFLV